MAEKISRKEWSQQAMATAIVLDPCWSDETTAVGTFLQERSTQFDARFSRCYGLLHFMACRVLEHSEGAEEAIENCRVGASQNPPEFEQEGAFRSWLVRILLDEAMAIRRRRLIY
jgi:DNA-directed RNA polymerase specialized sigma24 family protein